MIGANAGAAEQQRFVPADDGTATAKLILNSHKILREVLEESASTGKESGRTFCNPDGNTDLDGDEEVHGPAARTERSVNLRACPLGGGGIVHTHPVDRQRWRTPVHSLMDMSLVLHPDGYAASVVLGVQSSEVLVAPDDRASAEREFERIVGVSAGSSNALYQQIKDRPDEEIAAMHREARDVFSDLFSREPTRYAIQYSPTGRSTVVDSIQHQNKMARNVARGIQQTAGGLGIRWDTNELDVNLAEMVIRDSFNSVITGLTTVGFLILLGGTPAQLAAKATSEQ